LLLFSIFLTTSTDFPKSPLLDLERASYVSLAPPAARVLPHDQDVARLTHRLIETEGKEERGGQGRGEEEGRRLVLAVAFSFCLLAP
jgi:hypothetical protein